MKKICVLAGILLSLVVTGLVVKAKELDMQKELAKEVFRFHVLANSDSDEDQALKMKVKEAIIAYMKQELPQSDSVDTTKQWAKANLEELQKVAQRVIAEEGYRYSVKAQVTICDFPDKTYGDITFPAGKYEALRVEIGAADGQNWWCVLFPQVCTDTATPADEKLAQVGFTPSQIRLLTKQEEPEYRVKFKIVELIEALFGR